MAGEKDLRVVLADYFTATRRPLYSIIVAAPFFIAYELGIAVLLPLQPPEAQKCIKAASRLQTWAASLAGPHAAFLLPVALGIALLLYMDWRERREHRRRTSEPLGFQPGYIGWMFLEGFLLALPLRLALPKIFGMFAATTGPAGALAAASGGEPSLLFRLTTYCGAGAYEELLFRLFLFMGLSGLGRLSRLEKPAAGLAAAAVAAVAFAVFHNQGDPFNSAFDPAFLVFATVAGLYFSGICLYRSFGLAVATHASYDIMTVLSGM